MRQFLCPVVDPILPFFILYLPGSFLLSLRLSFFHPLVLCFKSGEKNM